MRSLLRSSLLLGLALAVLLGFDSSAHAQSRARRYAASCSSGQCGSYQAIPQVSYATPAVQPVQWGYAPQVAAQAQPDPIVYTVATTVPSYMQPAQAPAQAQPQADPYGFVAWLNGVRAQSGLGAVQYDQNLSAWAASNSQRGFGHSVRAGRRQNVGMGAFGAVCQMWLASGPHRVALLDPGITRVGIANAGGVWTFNGD